jgi:hypothetical protein
MEGRRIPTRRSKWPKIVIPTIDTTIFHNSAEQKEVLLLRRRAGPGEDAGGSGSLRRLIEKVFLSIRHCRGSDRFSGLSFFGVGGRRGPPPLGGSARG